MALYVVSCLLRERLREIKMSQAELARRTGINRKQISDYATFRYTMKIDTARLIAETIGCEIFSLYEWDTSRPEKRSKRVKE